MALVSAIIFMLDTPPRARSATASQPT
jgi:hypothetical protein